MAVMDPLRAPLVVQDDVGTTILLMAFGPAPYSTQVATLGLLSGRRLWDPYTALTITDILVRVALTLVTWYPDWGLLT